MRKSPNNRPGLTLMELTVVLVILAILAGIVVPMISSASQDAQDTATKATMKTLRDAVIAYHQDMKGIPLPRAIPGTAFATDSTGMPQTLQDLQLQPAAFDANGNSIAFNPVTRRGWRGPYLMQSTGAFGSSATLHSSFNPPGNPYGVAGDPAFVDAWGNPIVLQWPSVGTGSSSDPIQDLALRVLNVRLVSAGQRSSAGGISAHVIETPANHLAATLTKDLRGNDFVMFILAQDYYP